MNQQEWNTIEHASFGDVFDLDEIQKIQDAFAVATGVASIITDTEGRPITRPSNFCRLCEKIIRGTEKGAANCMHSDAVLGSPHPEGPIIQPCLSGGLWDGGTSIFLGERHIANWLIGQILSEDFDPERLQQYAKEIGADEQEFREATAEITRMSVNQFRQVGQTLFLLAKLLSRQALQNMQQRRELAERKQAERALRQSEERFRDIALSTSDWVWEVDAQGHYTYCSEKVYDLLGYTVEEMLGKTPFDFMLPEEVARIAPAFGAIAADKRPIVNLENWNARKDGQAVCLLTDGAPILDTEGNLLGYRGVDKDITGRKQAEAAAQLDEIRLQALLQLNQMAEATEQEIANFALEGSMQVTQSQIGYLAFMNEDETILTMYAWSKTAMDECKVLDKPIDYPIETTGLWGEAVRQRKPIITNDYAAPSPHKKGYPQGHVRVVRHMNIPVFDGGRIVAVAGVGNKAADYDEQDVRQLTLLMNGMWQIIRRKRVEGERARLQQDIIEAQQQALKELSTPIIPVMDRIIVMPLIGSIDTLRAKDITRSLLHGISEHRAKVVILDITGVPLVDSGVANHLNKTIQAARLKGARTIVTGVSDAVAETIVDLGIDWSGIETVRDLQTGLVAALGSLGVEMIRK